MHQLVLVADVIQGLVCSYCDEVASRPTTVLYKLPCNVDPMGVAATERQRAMVVGIVVAMTTTMGKQKRSRQRSRRRRVAGGRENEMLWMVRGKSKVGGLLELAKWEGEIPRWLCSVECGELPWSCKD